MTIMTHLMNCFKRNRKNVIVVLAITTALAVVWTVFWWNDRVARLIIVKPEDEITLMPGHTVQLEVEGYTRDGTPIPPEKLERMDLSWGTNSDVVSVDENGMVRADMVKGQWAVNVWVSAKNNVQARPVTIWVRTKKPVEDTRPCCVMYNDQLYVTWQKQTREPEKLEQVGVVESAVPINQLPTENFQTNAFGYVGRSLWIADGQLLIDGEEDGSYFVFEKMP